MEAGLLTKKFSKNTKEKKHEIKDAKKVLVENSSKHDPNQTNNIHSNLLKTSENKLLGKSKHDISEYADFLFNLERLKQINNSLISFFPNEAKGKPNSKIKKESKISRKGFFSEIVIDENSLSEISNFLYFKINNNNSNNFNFKDCVLKETNENIFQNTNDYINKLITSIKSNLSFFKKFVFILDLVINYTFLRLNYLLYFYTQNAISFADRDRIISKQMNILQNTSRFVLQMINIYCNEIEAYNKSSKICFLCILYTLIQTFNIDLALENNNGNKKFYGYFSNLIKYMKANEKDNFSSIKDYLKLNENEKISLTEGYDNHNCFNYFLDLFNVCNYLFLFDYKCFFEKYFETDLPSMLFKSNNDFTVIFILIENIMSFHSNFLKSFQENTDKDSNNINFLIKREVKINQAALITCILDLFSQENLLKIFFNQNFYKSFALRNRIEIEEKFVRVFLTFNQIFIENLNSDFLELADINNNIMLSKFDFLFLNHLETTEKHDVNVNIFIESRMEKDLFSFNLKGINYKYYSEVNNNNLRKFIEDKLNLKKTENPNAAQNYILIFDFFFYLLLSNKVKIQLFRVIEYLRINVFKKAHCEYDKEDEIFIGSYQENIFNFMQNNINEYLLLAKKFKILFNNNDSCYRLFIEKSNLKAFFTLIFNLFIDKAQATKNMNNNNNNINEILKSYFTPCKNFIKSKQAANDELKENNENSTANLFKKIHENERKIICLNLVGKLYNFYAFIGAEEDKIFFSNYILGFYASDKLIINETLYIKVNQLKDLIDSLAKKTNVFLSNYKDEEILLVGFEGNILAYFLIISKGIQELELITTKIKFLNKNVDIDNFLNLSNYILNYGINFLFEFIKVLKCFNNYFNKQSLLYFEYEYSLNKEDLIYNDKMEAFFRIEKNHREIAKAIVEYLTSLRRVAKTSLKIINYPKFTEKKNNNNKQNDKNPKTNFKHQKESNNNNNNNKNNECGIQIKYSEIKNLFSSKIKKNYSLYWFLKVFKLKNPESNPNEFYELFKIIEENKKDFINNFCGFYDENQSEDENTIKRRIVFILNFYMLIEQKEFLNLNSANTKEIIDFNFHLKNVKIIFLVIAKLESKFLIELVNIFLENLLEILNKEPKAFYFLCESKMNLVNDIICNFLKTTIEKNPFSLNYSEDSKDNMIIGFESRKLFKNLEKFYFFVFEGLNNFVFSNKNYEKINIAKIIYPLFFNETKDHKGNEAHINLNFFVNFYCIQVINIAKISFLFDKHCANGANNNRRFYVSAFLQLIFSIVSNVNDYKKLRNMVLIDIWDKQILENFRLIKSENEKEYYNLKNLVFSVIYPIIKNDLYPDDIDKIKKFLNNDSNGLDSLNVFNKLAEIYILNNIRNSNANCLDDSTKRNKIDLENNEEKQKLNKKQIKDNEINKATLFLEKSLQVFTNIISYATDYLRFFDYLHDLIKTVKNKQCITNNSKIKYIHEQEEVDLLRSKKSMDIVQKDPTIDKKLSFYDFSYEFGKDNSDKELSNLNEFGNLEDNLEKENYKKNFYNFVFNEQANTLDLKSLSVIEEKDNFEHIFIAYFKTFILFNYENKAKANLSFNSEAPYLNSKIDFISNCFKLKNISKDLFAYNISSISEPIFYKFKSFYNEKSSMKFDGSIRDFHSLFSYFDFLQQDNLKQMFHTKSFSNKFKRENTDVKINEKLNFLKAVAILIKYNLLFSNKELDLKVILLNYELINKGNSGLDETVLFCEIKHVLGFFSSLFEDLSLKLDLKTLDKKKLLSNQIYKEKLIKLLEKEVI